MSINGTLIDLTTFSKLPPESQATAIYEAVWRMVDRLKALEDKIACIPDVRTEIETIDARLVQVEGVVRIVKWAAVVCAGAAIVALVSLLVERAMV